MNSANALAPPPPSYTQLAVAICGRHPSLAMNSNDNINNNKPWRQGSGNIEHPYPSSSSDPSIYNSSRTRGLRAEEKKAAAPPPTARLRGSLPPSIGAPGASTPYQAQATPDPDARRTARSAAVGADYNGEEGGGGDAEDGSCRATSAYILLQLKDMGRSSSASDDKIVDERPLDTTSSTFPSSPSLSSSHSGINGSIPVQHQRYQHEKQNQQQLKDARAILPHASSVGRASAGAVGSNGLFPSTMSPTGSPSTSSRFGPLGTVSAAAAAASAATAASSSGSMVEGKATASSSSSILERGIYAAGLLPGFQSVAASPSPSVVPSINSMSGAAAAAAVAAAAAASQQTSLIPQLPPALARSAVASSAVGGGSAALRPICPKRTPESMARTLVVGELAPVSFFFLREKALPLCRYGGFLPPLTLFLSWPFFIAFQLK